MVANTDILLKVARMYHIHGETMESIAHGLGVSRSTVSRLLKDARERGLVRVTIVDSDRPTDRVTELFRRQFNVTAHLVPSRAGTNSVFRLDQVATVAARLLEDLVEDGNTIGVAWGTTTSAIASQLRPQPRTGVTVVGLNGGANHRTSGMPYVGSILGPFAAAFGAEEHAFPMPAFFDNPDTRDAMFRERSTRHLLDVRAATRIAVFGVGGFGSQLQSHVYSANYLDDETRRQLASLGVVGDVCTVMLREDGTWRDLAFNRRATGMTPDELRTIERRLCVVSGVSKASPVLGALRAGVATDLIIDDETAREVLNRANALPTS